MDDIGVTEAEAYDALREAMGVRDDAWEHDEHTWTVRDLMELFDIGDASARRKAAEAVADGKFVKGIIKSERGHYVAAYRLAGRE